jgi:hypothetical protein
VSSRTRRWPVRLGIGLLVSALLGLVGWVGLNDWTMTVSGEASCPTGMYATGVYITGQGWYGTGFADWHAKSASEQNVAVYSRSNVSSPWWYSYRVDVGCSRTVTKDWDTNNSSAWITGFRHNLACIMPPPPYPTAVRGVCYIVPAARQNTAASLRGRGPHHLATTIPTTICYNGKDENTRSLYSGQ